MNPLKSIAILDEESLLSVCAYIDLNPVAAGIATTPEDSPHTSVKARVEHVKASGRVADVQAAELGSAVATQVSAGLEDDLWLVPIEDRRERGSQREGMRGGFTLANYLVLVEYTGRVIREGKAVISNELADILQRIGSSAESWIGRMTKLSGKRPIGRFLAASRQRLRELASQLKVRHLANVGG